MCVGLGGWVCGCAYGCVSVWVGGCVGVRMGVCRVNPGTRTVAQGEGRTAEGREGTS